MKPLSEGWLGPGGGIGAWRDRWAFFAGGVDEFAEGLGPVAGLAVGDVFLDVGEHAGSAARLVAGLEAVFFDLPEEVRVGFGDEFFVFGRAHGFLGADALVFAIAGPVFHDEAFVADTFVPGGAEAGDGGRFAEWGKDDLVVDFADGEWGEGPAFDA